MWYERRMEKIKWSEKVANEGLGRIFMREEDASKEYPV